MKKSLTTTIIENSKSLDSRSIGPRHVAIIMDGNGRWAQGRFRPRVWGHVRGAKIVSDIVEEADNCGVKVLTLYAFSTENWLRPIEEVKTLFKILKKFIIRERARILANNIKFHMIGDRTTIPTDILEKITDLENVSQQNTGLVLTFAFNYGGRAEIISAFNDWLSSSKENNRTMNTCSFEKFLDSDKLGDVDLLIRTGGELRISNFLLWKIAYAELFFTKTAWPDFTREEFRNILLEIKNRQRRFGKVEASINDSILENTVTKLEDGPLFEQSLG